jgi:hypothetical protein
VAILELAFGINFLQNRKLKGSELPQQPQAREAYKILHFIFPKNVKIGIKCSIVIPDSPQKDK